MITISKPFSWSTNLTAQLTQYPFSLNQFIKSKFIGFWCIFNWRRANNFRYQILQFSAILQNLFINFHCLKPINADWFNAKFYKTECDITIHLLSFYSVLTHFQQNKRNERLRDNFWAIARLFYFVYYLQNGEKFAFKPKFLEALRQFNSTHTFSTNV